MVHLLGGRWSSLVGRRLYEAEAAGSNPARPTFFFMVCFSVGLLFLRWFSELFFLFANTYWLLAGYYFTRGYLARMVLDEDSHTATC